MMNICLQCGMYHADKAIDPVGPFAICPECGYRHPFLQIPLLIVSGASGTGKSTVCQQLLMQKLPAVLLDSDIIWRPEFNHPETHYRDFFETWLRLSKNISQSGRPVVLFGAGCGVPENLEKCIERRYFSTIHYLALTCSEEEIRQRLLHRPAWRGTNRPDFIEEQIFFTRWFETYTDQPPITLVDTTIKSPGQTSRQVTAWIENNLHLALGD
jgi:hypothetical protein